MNSATEHALYPRFRAAWEAVDAGDPEAAWQEVVRCYTQPHRHYHDLHHIERLFAAKDRVIPDLPLSPELTLALVLHDVVYEPGAHDNETRSADFAANLLGRADPEVRRRVAHLVRVTRHHQAHDREEELLVDLDLSGFAGDLDEFQRLFDLVRAEFPELDEQTFRRRHVQAIRHLVERDPIYRSPEFRAAFEAEARRNIHHLLAGTPECP